MSRVTAILLSSNLIPEGSPDIWLGCQISNDLTSATHPVVDENGVLKDPQPYPPTHDILLRLTLLWQNNIHNWDQVLYHPPSLPPTSSPKKSSACDSPSWASPPPPPHLPEH